MNGTTSIPSSCRTLVDTDVYPVTNACFRVHHNEPPPPLFFADKGGKAGGLFVFKIRGGGGPPPPLSPAGPHRGPRAFDIGHHQTDSSHKKYKDPTRTWWTEDEVVTMPTERQDRAADGWSLCLFVGRIAKRCAVKSILYYGRWNWTFGKCAFVPPYLKQVNTKNWVNNRTISTVTFS